MPLHNLFYPKSVALIGASKDEGSVGNEIAKNLITQGYKGKVFLTNPKDGKLFGKKLLTDTSQINIAPDLAIVSIPAKFVLEEVKKLADLKVKSIITISAGFKEAGNKESENELAEICTKNGISLIGPNCIGVINPQVKLNASFAPIMPKSGDIAFISQSGALCASVLDFAAKINLGFSKFVSVGNKAQIGEAQLLEYFMGDPKTKVIAMYLEELDDSKLIQEYLKKINGKPKKPVVVLKAGTTEAGKKAAKSHTGSIGGSDSAYEAFFAQTGIIRAKNIEELFEIIECFTRNVPLKNNNIAVITNAGGPGVLTSDELNKSGLKLAKFSAITREKLQKVLPPSASIKNPVDILGDADATRYKEAISIILSDKNVSALQIILTPQSMTQVKETAKVILSAKRSSKKPLIATFMGQDLVESGLEILNDNNVATSTFPEVAARALWALNFFRSAGDNKAKEVRFTDVKPQIVREILNSQRGTTGVNLPMELAFKILEAYKFPTLKRTLIKTEEEAVQISKRLNGKFVLRIVSPEISHKTDVGGVILNVDSKDIPGSYKKLISDVHKKKPKAKIDGVDIAPMIENPGAELILGAKTDLKLGKQIMLGLGGIYTEVIKDVSWGVVPLTNKDIERMIGSLKINKILSGYRGHPPLDVKKISESTARLSQLLSDFPQIKEVDINPLLALEKGQGVVALDVRMVISDDMM